MHRALHKTRREPNGAAWSGSSVPVGAPHTRRARIRRCSPATTPPDIPELPLLSCWPPSPCGRLSRPPRRVVTPATTTGPPPHPALLGRTRAFHPNRTGCPDRVGGAQDDSHVHRTIDRSGRHPALPRQHRRAYAADLRRGLPTDGQRRLRSQPPPQIPLRGRGGGCALHPGPYPPVSSRQSGYGASTTGSLTLYLLTLLDEPAPSGSAGTSRLCRGRLPPSPAFPGSGCPQLLPGRCDGPRETVSHHLSIYPAPRGALDHPSICHQFQKKFELVQNLSRTAYPGGRGVGKAMV